MVYSHLLPNISSHRTVAPDEPAARSLVKAKDGPSPNRGRQDATNTYL